MKINLAIVEDNADLLRNLQLILSYYDELHIAAVFTNAEDCMAAFDTLAVDVVIMDINLPGKSGIYAVETLKPIA
jgi:DNA-binding NarL/FixJ family response regulator